LVFSVIIHTFLGDQTVIVFAELIECCSAVNVSLYSFVAIFNNPELFDIGYHFEEANVFKRGIKMIPHMSCYTDCEALVDHL